MPSSLSSSNAPSSVSVEDSVNLHDLLRYLAQVNDSLRASRDALSAANEALERRVADQSERIRRLSLALASAEQRERTRISEILHDHVQQLIHGAKIWAETLHDEGDDAPPESLDRIVALLHDAIAATRSLTVDLSPPVLHSAGLPGVLKWLASRVSETHDMHVTLNLDASLTSNGAAHDDGASEDGDTPVDDASLRVAHATLLALFEVSRELLFNVAKHAGVDHASINARRTDAGYVVEVVDEGVGFDPDSLCTSPDEGRDACGGVGLAAIRQRLSLIGGSLTIDSTPGRGTRARAFVPDASDDVPDAPAASSVS